MFGGDKLGGSYYVRGSRGIVTTDINVVSEDQLVVSCTVTHPYHFNLNLVVARASPHDGEADVFQFVFQILPIEVVEVLACKVDQHFQVSAGETVMCTCNVGAGIGIGHILSGNVGGVFSDVTIKRVFGNRFVIIIELVFYCVSRSVNQSCILEG